MPNNIFLRSALAYASRMHWPVFPLRTRAKDPLTPHGYKDATLDALLIREWWRKHPDANIGIPTGVTFWALDTDPRNGGAESLEALINRHSGLPDTIQQITGGGGRHHLFALDAAYPLGCGTLTSGIDYKGIGGYIVVAPSIHPSGQAYTWDGISRITQQKLLPAPAWLIQEITHPAKSSGKVDWKIPEVVKDGEKHYTIVSLAGTLRTRNVPLEAAFAACRALPFESPVSDADIRQRVESVYRKYPAPAAHTEPAANSLNIAAGAFGPSLALLNAMVLFHGRIEFVSIERRGSMILATTGEGHKIIWPTIADLTSFSKSRAVVAEGTNVLLPPPAKGQVLTQWDAASRMILRLAASKALKIEPVLQSECRDLLRLFWHYADQPSIAIDDQNANSAFIQFMRAAVQSPRDPHATPPACVFVAEGYCWVHVPSFRLWLSIPHLTNKLYPLADIRNGLMLLGFTYLENVTRRSPSDSETLCLWRGPCEVLSA